MKKFKDLPGGLFLLESSIDVIRLHKAAHSNSSLIHSDIVIICRSILFNNFF